MADYLKLLDGTRCPRCFCHRVVHFTQCNNCGTLLFTRPINFYLFEEDGNHRNWWFFHAKNGWMHRDAVMIADFKPNEREYKAPKLPDNYGKETTPEEVQARGGKLRLKGKVKKKPRRFF